MDQVAHNARPDLPPRPVFPQGSSGISIARLGDGAVLNEIRQICEYYFPQSVDHYVALDPEDYRELIFNGQLELNRRDVGRRLAKDRYDTICEVLDTQKPLIQSNVYLRATRPHVSGIQESIGWHRESFYGPDMDQSINFWTPVANVNAANVMQYIPDSHLVPDAEIETVGVTDESVARFSAGHKVGLLYAPKEIVSGVDLSTAKPFCVLPGEVAIFAGALIHGAAANHSNQIRFSLDFRLIAEESLQTSKEHFASGRSYFEPL